MTAERQPNRRMKGGSFSARSRAGRCPRMVRIFRSLLRAGLAAALLALGACDNMVGPSADKPPPPAGGGFTLSRERVVGFPALFAAQRDGFPEDEARIREAEEEAARVSAMHGRGGTGAGQLVGTIESGANPDHPDLKGKFPHTCALGHCDDGRPNRPDHSPLLDTDDHGTQVNGIIAARKNGTGVYGVAYDARIASFGNSASTYHPWGNDCAAGDDCPSGVSDKRHLWSELFDQEIARGIDWMRSLGVRVTNFSWGRTYEWSREKETRFGLTRDSVGRILPVTLRAFDAYVAAGGVAVWGAGNGDSLHPAVEGMVPRYFPDLEKGWLVVVGLGQDGHRIDHFLSLLRRCRQLVHRRAGGGRDDPPRRTLDRSRRNLHGRALRRGRSGSAEEHVPEPEPSSDSRLHSGDSGQEPAL